MLDSTNTVPGFAPLSAPSSPIQVFLEASSSASILMTTSASLAASAGVPAIRAPNVPSGAAFADVLLWTATVKPALRRFFAIPIPMVPNPRIATRCVIFLSASH